MDRVAKIIAKSGNEVVLTPDKDSSLKDKLLHCIF